MIRYDTRECAFSESLFRRDDSHFESLFRDHDSEYESLFRLDDSEAPQKVNPSFEVMIQKRWVVQYLSFCASTENWSDKIRASKLKNFFGARRERCENSASVSEKNFDVLTAANPASFQPSKSPRPSALPTFFWYACTAKSGEIQGKRPQSTTPFQSQEVSSVPWAQAFK
jgi:hypothetical protein